jgi:DNA-binding transcriptional LysR family regulator
VALAEENVSRAALKLHVWQPALTRQIRDLEDEIGFSLLERTAKSEHSRWDTRWPPSTRIDRSSPEGSALHDLRYEELFHELVCVAVAPQHPFVRRRAIPIADVAAEPLIASPLRRLSLVGIHSCPH